jgi:hypothetical protein
LKTTIAYGQTIQEIYPGKTMFRVKYPENPGLKKLEKKHKIRMMI